MSFVYLTAKRQLQYTCNIFTLVCSFKKMSWEMLFFWYLRTNKICQMRCLLQKSQTN